ncbi:nucleotide exchange factor GrpE [Buchnera aphidicola (Hormaphis cornu)]|nr:nucleotide exchange factor GrpE [Buchnera aphidicola (Hormaphis cornu)]
MQIESKQKLDSFCVRTNKEIHNVLNFCLEKFILDLLPVIDNLERTVVLIKKSDDNQKKIYNELKSLLKSFLDLLYEFGVKVIDQENVLFDPSKHEAMSVNYSSHIEPNNIITILQKGYLLNQRLLRPAMVIVSQRK